MKRLLCFYFFVVFMALSFTNTANAKDWKKAVDDSYEDGVIGFNFNRKRIFCNTATQLKFTLENNMIFISGVSVNVNQLESHLPAPAPAPSTQNTLMVPNLDVLKGYILTARLTRLEATMEQNRKDAEKKIRESEAEAENRLRNLAHDERVIHELMSQQHLDAKAKLKKHSKGVSTKSKLMGALLAEGSGGATLIATEVSRERGNDGRGNDERGNDERGNDGRGNEADPAQEPREVRESSSDEDDSDQERETTGGSSTRSAVPVERGVSRIINIGKAWYGVWFAAGWLIRPYFEQYFGSYLGMSCGIVNRDCTCSEFSSSGLFSACEELQRRTESLPWALHNFMKNIKSAHADTFKIPVGTMVYVDKGSIQQGTAEFQVVDSESLPEKLQDDSVSLIFDDDTDLYTKSADIQADLIFAVFTTLQALSERDEIAQEMIWKQVSDTPYQLTDLLFSAQEYWETLTDRNQKTVNSLPALIGVKGGFPDFFSSAIAKQFKRTTVVEKNQCGDNEAVRQDQGEAAVVNYLFSSPVFTLFAYCKS